MTHLPCYAPRFLSATVSRQSGAPAWRSSHWWKIWLDALIAGRYSLKPGHGLAKTAMSPYGPLGGSWRRSAWYLLI